MSEVHDGEVHIEEEEAIASSREGVVRWVLLFSTLAAALILTIIWVAGAWMQGDVEEEAVMSEQVAPEETPFNDPLLADEDNEAAEISDDEMVEDGLQVIEND